MPGFPQVLHLPLERIALVAGASIGSETFETEVDEIEKLAEPRKTVKIPPRYMDVTDALASGSYDGWHFATHGVSRSPPDRAWIALDSERFTPVDLSGSVGRLGTTRPLVVLSGPPVVGWEHALLKAGAGAIVGPLWTPTDQAAHAFSLKFYRNFLAGSPLAQAVHEARLAVRAECPGDSSWLAFTAYGHPLATCKR
jgi:CHAT domain-containing protein